MARYPDTVQFNRLNRPIGIEWTARNLEVEGQIPAEIQGGIAAQLADKHLQHTSLLAPLLVPDRLQTGSEDAVSFQQEFHVGTDTLILEFYFFVKMNDAFHLLNN